MTYFKMRQSCDFAKWLIQSCYQSVSPCVTETLLRSDHVLNFFKKCFSAENILSLNTVIIPIIGMGWLSKVT